MSEFKTLNLDDLNPQETHFSLHIKKGAKEVKKIYTLKPFSLLAREWALQNIGRDGLKEAMEKRDIVPLSRLAYFLLKDKSDFPTFESFLESICTVKDMIGLSTAVCGTIGLGEPQINEIKKALDKEGKPKSPNSKSLSRKKTGARSSIR